MQAYYGFIVRAKTKFEADIDQFEKNQYAEVDCQVELAK